MRCAKFTYLIVLALLSFTTMAAAAPTTQPTTDVTIAPFSSISDSSKTDWIGKAVQQNLIADLAWVHFRPTESAVTGGYIIRGSYQSSDQLIRFSGELVEAQSGQVVAGLSATGAVSDLFSLEDTLSNQAIQQLRRLTASTTPPATATHVPTIADLVQPAVACDEPSGPSYLDGNQAPSNSYSDQYEASHNRQMYQYQFSNCYYAPYYTGYFYGPIFPRGRFGFNGFYSGGTYGTTTR